MPEQGWYEDPNDATQLRWWDGEAWTDRRRPMPTEQDLTLGDEIEVDTSGNFESREAITGALKGCAVTFVTWLVAVQVIGMALRAGAPTYTTGQVFSSGIMGLLGTVLVFTAIYFIYDTLLDRFFKGIVKTTQVRNALIGLNVVSAVFFLLLGPGGFFVFLVVFYFFVPMFMARKHWRQNS